MSEILVSIITVNYRQAEVTNALISSLSAVRTPAFELIVVDNDSGDGEAEKVNTDPSFVRLVKSDYNRGFAGGNNLGYQAARGKYILFLNNDTEVPPDFMQGMVKLLEEDGQVGAVSPKICYYESPDIIQYAGYTRMNPLTLRMHALGFRERDQGQHELLRESPFAHGCAMMVPRKVIEDAGPMRETYFLYYEEHDWSMRIRKAGYKIMYQPASKVYHKESMTIVKDSPLKTHYINRNRILFMRYHTAGFRKLVASTYLLFVSMPKNALAFLFTGKRGHLRAYARAIWWHIRHPSIRAIEDKPMPSHQH